MSVGHKDKDTIEYTLKKKKKKKASGLSWRLSDKNLPAFAGDTRNSGSIPGLGISPGEGTGNPLQYSCPGNPKDKGVWRSTVHGVVTEESDTTQ